MDHDPTIKAELERTPFHWCIWAFFNAVVVSVVILLIAIVIFPPLAVFIPFLLIVWPVMALRMRVASVCPVCGATKHKRAIIAVPNHTTTKCRFCKTKFVVSPDRTHITFLRH